VTIESTSLNIWKPKNWIILLLGFLLGQFVFLYVNRATYFWIYLAIGFITGIATLLVHEGLILGWYVVCITHAIYLNRFYDETLKRNWYSKWWGITLSLIVLTLVLILIKTFLIEPFRIPASSMSPNLNEGNFILVNKIGYGSIGAYGLYSNSPILRGLERGEIYIFKPPQSNQVYVKRLLGIPGDHIEFDRNQIYINDILIEQSLIQENRDFSYYVEELYDKTYSIKRTKHSLRKFEKKLVVPADSYFFIGDNRDNSRDSRSFGFIEKNYVMGKVVLIINWNLDK